MRRLPVLLAASLIAGTCVVAAGSFGAPAAADPSIGSCWGTSSLTLTVRTPSGEAVGGADVALTRSATCSTEPQRTGADGRVVFTGLVDGAYTLAARSGGLQFTGPSPRRVVVEGATTATVEATRSQSIAGRIQTADGALVSGSAIGSNVRVLASSATGVATSGVIAADGSFTVADAPSGDVRLSLVAGGLAYVRAVPMAVRVDPGASVVGVRLNVTREAGQFYVTISPTTSAGSHLRLEPLTAGQSPIVLPVPPATGGFWTPPVPIGDYRVRIDGSSTAAPTYAPSSSTVAGAMTYTLTAGGAKTVNVQMLGGSDPAVRPVRMLLRDANGVALPSTYLDVHAHDPGAGQTIGAQTAADGTAVVHLRPGGYTIATTSTATSGSLRQTVTIPAGNGVFDLAPLTAPRLPVLMGTVRGPGGSPVAGAVLSSPISSATTRADGTYSMTVPDGTAVVSVRPPAGSPLAGATVVRNLPVASVSVADVDLVTGGAVAFRVDGAGASCMSVTLEPVSGAGHAPTGCAGSGATTTIAGVPAGQYVLRLGSSMFHPVTPDRAAATVVTVTAGATTTLSTVSMPGIGVLDLTATVDGTAVPGLRVRVARGDGTRVAVGTTTIGATGTASVTLANLPVATPLSVTVDSVRGTVVPWSGAFTSTSGTTRLSATLSWTTPPPPPPPVVTVPVGGGSTGTTVPGGTTTTMPDGGTTTTTPDGGTTSTTVDPSAPTTTVPGGGNGNGGNSANGNGGNGGAGGGIEPVVAGNTVVRAGYRLIDETGTVYGFGGAPVLGNATPTRDHLVVDIEPTLTGDGYWTVDSAGDVQQFGDAPDLGDPDRSQLDEGEDVTSISRTATGRGLWVFTSRGRVLTLGDAAQLGGMSTFVLNGPVLDSVATPSGRGYYMVASDGGVFAFGDAEFQGSMGGRPLNAPVQSLVPDPDGSGYWLVASDGGVFAFGAEFRGSMGGRHLNRPMTGMVPYGNGYLMVAEDGGVFVFSNLPFSGSLGSNPPAARVVSISATS